MESLLFPLTCVLFVAFFVGVAVLTVVLKPKIEKRRLEREVEAEMRRDIRVRAAEKKAADKILRERGLTP